MTESDRETILRIGWRLDALDRWRDQLEPRVSGLERQVSELKKADEIAEEVAKKVNAQQHVHLSDQQRRWAYAFGAFGALGAVSGFVALLLNSTGHA